MRCGSSRTAWRSARRIPWRPPPPLRAAARRVASRPCFQAGAVSPPSPPQFLGSRRTLLLAGLRRRRGRWRDLQCGGSFACCRDNAHRRGHAHRRDAAYRRYDGSSRGCAGHDGAERMGRGPLRRPGSGQRNRRSHLAAWALRAAHGVRAVAGDRAPAALWPNGVAAGLPERDEV